MIPPKAQQIPYHTEDGRVDLYHWLREKENPEVLTYLKAENEYTKAMLEGTDAMQEKLFQEMRKRIKETDSSAPWTMSGYDYYFRTTEALQYRIFCRKPHGSLIEEILLDENEVAKHHSYFHLGSYALSVDQHFLAYTVDTQGDEFYALVIKDLRTPTLVLETLQGVGDDVVFAADSQHFWYVRLDAAHRPYQIWQHKLQTPTAQDLLIYHETDERFFIAPQRTKDNALLLVESHSKLSSEIHYTCADKPSLPLHCVFPRSPHIEYAVEHHAGDLIIRTNDQAENFQIIRVPMHDLAKKNWRTLIAHDPHIAIEDFEVMQDFIVVHERRNGLPALHVLSFDEKTDYLIEVNDPTYSLELGDNWLTHSNVLRYEYGSMTTPHTVFDFDLTTKERTLIKQTHVAHYHANDYVSERLFATAADGTRIPMSIVYKKTNKTPAPLFLTAYGAYGSIEDAWFSNARLSLLERGFVFAIAHIRGGGEFGKPWHEEGRLFKKQNSFTDFIACAEHLIQHGFTSPTQLVINGGSAGGLLMGAVLNLRPDLFAACIAHVPFVDVLNTLQDPSLPLSITEYEEWGNPHQAEAHAYIAAYSPYDNIKAHAYPALLVTAGLTDWRVPYWEAAKWVAKLRTVKTDDHLLLLKTDLEAGHYGLSGRYSALREVALEYAFIFRVLNL